jgi:hypothetical protein
MDLVQLREYCEAVGLNLPEFDATCGDDAVVTHNFEQRP